MAVTIKDVAAAAGVSIATVSRVLNDKGPVREEVQLRVREAARRLRYVPHSGARSLITRSTRTVGVVLPDLHGEFFSELIRGLDRACRAGGFHLLVAAAHAGEEDVAAALRALRGRIDGLVVMSPDVGGPTLRANLPDGLPVVMLNCVVKDPGLDSISVDSFGGAFAMTRHMLECGHSRVAFVGGPPANFDARERLRGYREALAAAGVEWAAGLELPGDFSEESGHRAGQRLLEFDPRPDAVFAANDSMALGVLAALREGCVDVPGDVALAGFDDIPLAAFLTPPLSSVHVPIAEMGERAARRLLEAVASGAAHVPRHETLATAVVVRQSCCGEALQRESAARANGHPIEKKTRKGRKDR